MRRKQRLSFSIGYWAPIGALALWAGSAFAQVDTVWVRRYDGPVHDRDRANAVAVDDSGNVLVTGESPGTGGPYYCTIKYKPNGDTAWVRRFRGIGFGSFGNAGMALAVDAWGNAYVTGSSGGVQDHDYYTIKYRPNGDTAWVRRYAGPGISEDYAKSLTIDGQGYIYVAGQGDSSRHLTLKYDSLGSLLWSRRYPPSQGTFLWPLAKMPIGVNRNGEVYVAGSSYLTSTSDFLLVKYNSNGDTLWSRRYDGPAHDNDGVNALAVDDSGNVYVTGISTGIGTGYDWCTIKYRSNGDVAWVQRYNGLGNYDDYPNAIALDGLGSVYVTGDCWDGISGGVNFCTFKYDTGGAIRWLRKYDGGVNQDGATSIALDRGGNPYVAGYSDRSGSGADYCIIKYNPTGVQQGIAFYGGPISSDDWIAAIVMDTAGNIFVTGNSVGDTVGFLNYDYCTIKYRQVVGVEEGRQHGVIKGQCLELSVVSPMNGEVRGHFFLPRSGEVKLELFDVTGRLLRVLTEGRREAGSHAYRCPLEMPGGVYFLRLSTGEDTIVRKGVVVK